MWGFAVGCDKHGVGAGVGVAVAVFVQVKERLPAYRSSIVVEV